MRFPTRETDFWELKSAEEASTAHPQTFLIPGAAERASLTRGQAAKLMFELETERDGGVDVGVERMWVIVAERVGDAYIGILDNQPGSFERSESVYLCFGAEIPFRPEHVIDIADPPKEYADWQLGQEPERRWPR